MMKLNAIKAASCLKANGITTVTPVLPWKLITHLRREKLGQRVYLLYVGVLETKKQTAHLCNYLDLEAKFTYKG